MIILAILGTLCAIGWTLLVLFANGMASRPTDGIEGGWTIIAAWIGVAVLWLAWAVG